MLNAIRRVLIDQNDDTHVPNLLSQGNILVVMC